jgi:hypothetical protein
MKHKVSELEGALLDAAVAKAEGVRFVIESHMTNQPRPAACWRRMRGGDIDFSGGPYAPSTSWYDGGPIIQRERIVPLSWKRPDGSIVWTAEVGALDSRYIAEFSGPDSELTGGEPFAPTPLIAAMRALVAAKLGEEVELP